MKHSTRFIVVALLALGAIASSARAAFPPDVRQAIQASADEVQKSLASAGLPAGKTISVLPLRLDQDRYVEGLLKNAVTAAGLTYVEGSQDPLWEEILREVEWDERKEDMLDGDTVTRFGRLKGTQFLLYGVVREASLSGQRVFVELELHLTSIETKQHVWGHVFSRRFYLPGQVEGIVSLEPEVRAVLQEAVAKMAPALRSSEKLKPIRSVALVPLAGDIDSYVASLVNDALSQTQLYPKQLDIGTLGEARQLLRDQPQQADALLFGAVRDLSRTQEEELPTSTRYEINAEVQLQIQSASTGEILWSGTLQAQGEDIVRRNWWEMLKQNPKAFLIAIGVLVALFVLKKLKDSMTRVR